MKHSPAFQLYADQWLGSTKIATMTPAEEGAYVRLLCHCWNDPDCTIPDDDDVLAALSRLGEAWLKGSSTRLRKCFAPHPRKPGRLFNARLLEERKKQEAWRKKSREGGIRSGQSRALKSEQSGTATEGWLKGGSRMVEPKGNSLSLSLSSLKKKKTNAASSVTRNGFDTFWAAYPRKKNKGQVGRVWSKLKPDDVLLGLMLQKIEQASQTPDWKKEGGKYIPYPATWLNAKGWLDELPSTPKERIPV